MFIRKINYHPTMTIRNATPLDANAIRDLILIAFPQDEAPMIAQLATDLLTLNTSPPTLSLVAEHDGAIVGHIAFSPVTFNPDNGLLGYILAPLSVAPNHQKRGVGSQLIEHGVNQLKQNQTDILFVYGDPNYYTRFGFNTETATPFTAPYPLTYPFGWMATSPSDHDTAQQHCKVGCVAPLRDPEFW
jgi:putative acetyltransferase